MIGGVEVHSYNPPQVLLVNVPKRHGPWVGSFRPDKNSHWCTVGPAGLPLGVATLERAVFTGSITVFRPICFLHAVFQCLLQMLHPGLERVRKRKSNINNGTDVWATVGTSA